LDLIREPRQTYAYKPTKEILDVKGTVEVWKIAVSTVLVKFGYGETVDHGLG